MHARVSGITGLKASKVKNLTQLLATELEYRLQISQTLTQVLATELD